MKEPGGKSRRAKRPDWPFAGWRGLRIGVMRTSTHGPRGVDNGTWRVSLGFVRKAVYCKGVRAFEYMGVRK